MHNSYIQSQYNRLRKDSARQNSKSSAYSIKPTTLKSANIK